jgi:hypothetical protein
MTDFSVAEGEFLSQIETLRMLLDTVEIASRHDLDAPVMIGSDQLPIPGGSAKNTMAASAIVMLAAYFEECVRQHTEECANHIIQSSDHFDEDFSEHLMDCYWRASSARLGRIRPKGDPHWITTADPILRNLISYPISQDVGSFNAKTLSDLTGRVGVKRLSDRLYEDIDLREHAQISRRDETKRELQKQINAFYILRNSIVHDISQNAGIGRSIVEEWMKFFSLFIKALTTALSASMVDFDGEIARRLAEQEA